MRKIDDSGYKVDGISFSESAAAVGGFYISCVMPIVVMVIIEKSCSLSPRC